MSDSGFEAGSDPPDPLQDENVRAVDEGLDVDIVVVGAGISGIGTGIELLRRGHRSFVLLEAGPSLGGTWRDNTYPGVAVDIPSISYCFSFETDYPWSRAFANGDQILRYVQHCAEKYGIDKHIRYDSRVLCSRFDVVTHRWSTELATGSVVTSRYLVSATGLLSQPKRPVIDGLDTFAGATWHTARWNHDYGLDGRRVAIIGTGASAVQIVPEIGPRVAHLSVFQRTPIWVGPRFDRALNHRSALAPRRWAPIRGVMRFFSELALDVLTFSIVNYRRFPFLVRAVQRCVRFTMRRQVDDPEVAAKLLPRYGLGCKRPASSNTYLPSFNLDTVDLVTEPIERICPEGIVTTDGTLHAVDALILATGFLTTEQGNAPSFEVVGAEGVELGQFWEENRLQAYSGVAVPGFPNFFLTAGPYSGGFNWFAMLEAHLGMIVKCLDQARSLGVDRVEIDGDAHARYMRHMWTRAEGTVFKDGACARANSYYLDRHGDAALPLPHTPWWRALRRRAKGVRDFRFGPPEKGGKDR